MRISSRLKKLEEAIPERRPCPVCGAEDANGWIGFEEHHLDGTVTYSGGKAPCPGCEKIEAERHPERVQRMIICHRHTYGLSCPICREWGGENEADLAIRRERFEYGHPEEAREIYAKYGEE